MIKFEYKFFDFPTDWKISGKNQEPHVILLESLKKAGDDGWEPIGIPSIYSQCLMKRQVIWEPEHTHGKA